MHNKSYIWALSLIPSILIPEAVAVPQCARQEMMALDSSPGGQVMGVALASDSIGRLLVGASLGTGNAWWTGAAHIFELSGTSWIRSHTLTASNGQQFDNFGADVGLSGVWAIIGAPTSGPVEPGGAYMFRYNGAIWTESQLLRPLSVQHDDSFGHSCALDGTTSVVGSPSGAGNVPETGEIYIFEWDGSAWGEVAHLWDPAGQFQDRFGLDVAIQGDWIVVGAHRDCTAGIQAGAIHFYRRVGGNWQFHSKVTAASPTPWQALGREVTIEGHRALASGGLTTLVFEFDGNSWIETAELVSVDVAQTGGIGIGSSLALDGSRAYIGAQGDDQSRGAVYVFEESAGQWSHIAKLNSPDLEGGNGLGDAVSASAGIVFAGARNRDNSPPFSDGSVLAFSLPNEFTPYCMNTTCPCSNTEPLYGCTNSTTTGSYLSACGTASVAADDLILTAENLPTSQWGIFYMGAGAIELPFGDGARCVGSGGVGTFRYAIQLSDTGGTLQLGPGIAALSQQRFSTPGHITAGDTWNFQAWFRDPGGPCGTAFNLSNAISIGFVP
ncbi:MAG: hypothetical protein ACI835_004280 [Planctomycetota bacterium]|jgi:hypothetical protein